MSVKIQSALVHLVRLCRWEQVRVIHSHAPMEFSSQTPLLGNDLARVLRWGAGYTGGEDPLNLLRDVIDAEEIRLDRWTVVFHPEDKPEDVAPKAPTNSTGKKKKDQQQSEGNSQSNQQHHHHATTTITTPQCQGFTPLLTITSKTCNVLALVDVSINNQYDDMR
jgi:hypothetical protein